MDRLWTPWRYAYLTGADTTLRGPGAPPDAATEATPDSPQTPQTSPSLNAAAQDAHDAQLARPGVPAALNAWPGADTGCVFCNLTAAVAWAGHNGWANADAERAALVLERREHTLLMLNAFPYTSGHLMVVPYAHQSSLAALPADVAAEVMDGMRRAESALRATYRPDGLNFGLNLGSAAGAGVAGHLHVHGLPRWVGDANFMTVVGETRVLPELLDTTWQRLRHALAMLD